MKKIIYALALLLSISSLVKANPSLQEKHVKITAATLYLGKHFSMRTPKLANLFARIPHSEKVHLKDHAESFEKWADIALTKESVKYLLSLVVPSSALSIKQYEVNVTPAVDPLVEIAFGVGSYCTKNHSATKKEFNVKEAGKAATKTAIRELTVHALVKTGEKTGITQAITNNLPDWAHGQTARTIYLQILRGGIDTLMNKYVK
ncbi:MAG: hypothetical protein ACOYT8_03540 [Candidatus Dependentiae bacterium]